MVAIGCLGLAFTAAEELRNRQDIQLRHMPVVQ
jgi:hypothetical protein